ncbi:MAG TPA: protease pro-enzyme activation domain-containing protein [Verrucomicrobiae bacterium]
MPSRVPATVNLLQSSGSVPDDARLNLVFGLPLRNKDALASLIQEIYNPASPQFHQYLKPAEFAERFGPAAKDYQALIDFAQSNHFQIMGIHPNRTLLDVSASVADIRRTLRVNIRFYQHPSEARTFYAPDAAASVDAGVRVSAVEGLDNYYGARSNLKLDPEPPSGGAQPSGGTGPGGGYIAQDLRKAYAPGVALTGAGQTAALVEFDGYYPSDITAYANKAGLSAVTLSNVLIDGFNGNPGSQNEEVAADTELLMALAPGISNIIIYEENQFSPVDDLLNRIATDDLAAQISCSWYFFAVDPAVQDQIFQQYAAQGQSFFCASGDFGAENSDQFAPPLGDPYITLVGGTMLSVTANGGAWQTENVWNNSSGGFTTNYPIPAWQAGINMAANQGSFTWRNAPDVAMCSSKLFVVANNGKNASFSGTSAGAPLWAAFAALINEQAAQSGNGPVGFLNPALYAIGTGSNYLTNFHDIIIGANTNSGSPDAFFAQPGYDLCSGWGTPNGSNLINALAPPDTLVMLPVPGAVFFGPAGGPFNTAGESYLLTNAGPAGLDWGLQCVAPWFSVSPSSGTLEPGQTARVTINLNSDAYNLPVGNYAAQMTITNLSNGLLHQRAFSLQIADPLSLSPAGGFEFAGRPGGPFNMSAIAFQLTNASQSSASWSLVSNPPWLDVSPSSGVLNPSGSVSLSCSLNAAATNLLAGVYSASLVITNNSFASAESVPVLFMVGQLVQNGGFETGGSSNWTLAGDPVLDFVTTDTNAVRGGQYGMILGEFGDVGYLSQVVPTTPGAPYVISLWLNTADALATNEFSVSWAGHTLCDLTNVLDAGWTNLQFNVWATGTMSALQFGFEDDAGDFGLDDISVTAVRPTSDIPSITWNNPAVITYGTGLSGAQLNASAILPGQFTYAPPAGTVLNAGSNVLTALFTPLDLVDYSVVTDYVGLAISPRLLTVTASNATRAYGIANPVFTGTLSGLQNGDNISASFNCAAAPGSPSGMYSIAPVLADPGGRLPNYQVTLVDGALTILPPAPATLQIMPLLSNSFLVEWSAVRGATYQVQVRPSLNSGGWSNLAGQIVATNTTAVLPELAGSSNYFYRVLQVPQ